MTSENHTESNSRSSCSSTLLKLTVLLLLCAAACFWVVKQRPAWLYPFKDLISTSTSKDKPKPQHYATLCEQLLAERSRIQDRYLHARSNRERDNLIAEAAALLDHFLPEMMHCWLGTPWDFNGTAAKPGSQPIACGYFVATLLHDAGFAVNRYQLAQQASQTIIRTFLPKSKLRISVREHYDHFVNDITQGHAGINIVGLDKHVGFIVVRGGEMQYTHSSGAKPRFVVAQDREHARSLKRSSYRVVGTLTSHAPTIKQWILNQPFAIGHFSKK